MSKFWSDSVNSEPIKSDSNSNPIPDQPMKELTNRMFNTIHNSQSKHVFFDVRNHDTMPSDAAMFAIYKDFEAANRGDQIVVVIDGENRFHFLELNAAIETRRAIMKIMDDFQAKFGYSRVGPHQAANNYPACINSLTPALMNYITENSRGLFGLVSEYLKTKTPIHSPCDALKHIKAVKKLERELTPKKFNIRDYDPAHSNQSFAAAHMKWIAECSERKTRIASLSTEYNNTINSLTEKVIPLKTELQSLESQIRVARDALRNIQIDNPVPPRPLKSDFTAE